MVKFTFNIAETAIGVTCLHESTKDYCSDYLTDAEPDIEITVTQEDIDCERTRAEETTEIPREKLVTYDDDYFEPLSLYRQIAEAMFDRDTILFHGSAIAVDGQTFLFTAPSGTGKSTHGELWRRVLPEMGHKVVTVNDDKPLIIIREDGVRICGTPWNGKHNLGENIILPLKAICSLSRAEETHVEKVSFEEMLPVLFKQTYRSSSPQKIAKTMQLLNTLSKHVDFYKLGCNMKRSAARIAYNGMKD